MHRIAAIDIGTVTMRLLIADLDEQGVIHELHRDICLTHIGKDTNATGCLNREGMERAYRAQEAFAQAIEEYGVKTVIGVATSASRDAKNSDEFLAGLKKRGLSVHIIPGEIEAALSFKGATYQRAVEDLLVIDPGGGSTECIFAHTADADLLLQSLNIGSRRLTDMFLHEEKATAREIELTRSYIAELFVPFYSELPARPQELVAVAGTATSLVTIKYAMEEYDPAAVHGQIITREDIETIIESLARKTVEERKAIVGLEPKRASVILAGVLIIAEIMRIAQLSRVTISDYDILYGIILSADLF